MVEWMDMVEMAIQKVCASKVYTSAEFKREKDNFHVSVPHITLHILQYERVDDFPSTFFIFIYIHMQLDFEIIDIS